MSKDSFLRKIASHLAGLLVVAGSTLSAADITWESPYNITGDSDVSTSGTLIQATGFVSTTVNGVAFNAFAYSAGITYTDRVFSLTGVYGVYGGYSAGAEPFTTFSTNYPVYKTLIENGDYGNSNSVMTLTISAAGLTVGNTYEFQWWANDPRSVSQFITATAGDSMTLNANTANATGGLGQYGIGTFVADGADMLINFQGGAGNGTLQNAFQLRDLGVVPEPGSYALLAIGSVLALRLRRRKD